MRNDVPFVLCIDVGGPKNIGWADSYENNGDGANLGDALDRLSSHLTGTGRAALGFEAPIWTPRRADLGKITSSRGGVETDHNRAWSAGTGACVLGAALSLMPWCLARVAKAAASAVATVDLQRFRDSGGLLLWEAFVSGNMKVNGASHYDDAARACRTFVKRWPNLVSDIPAEPAFNHAVSSALTGGLSIELSELTLPALVVGVQ